MILITKFIANQTVHSIGSTAISGHQTLCPAKFILGTTLPIGLITVIHLHVAFNSHINAVWRSQRCRMFLRLARHLDHCTTHQDDFRFSLVHRTCDLSDLHMLYVAFPYRNQRLFCHVFRSYRCVHSAVSLNFC